MRVVSSAFGTGADWEQEFFDEMEQGWAPFFDHLRLYLQHFPGQQVTRMDAEAQVAGNPRGRRPHDAAGARGRKRPGNNSTRAAWTRASKPSKTSACSCGSSDPVPGYLALLAWDIGDGKANANLAGYLFSEKASAYVEAERSNWKAWLDDLSVHTA